MWFRQIHVYIKTVLVQIVNRYVDIVKSKLGVSNSDIEINVESTVENEKSYLIYSILFKTLSYAQISTVTPSDFLVNPPTPEPESSEEGEDGEENQPDLESH